ncbi:hypothetical protein E2C01_012699 [Portunus trituberculatus]|uniref:Uncharacterized protein n=1 Tax=Portunus trituberculatus TaxID=210409 RepID=A0A5B7DET3_PORTR|nr:hypothetical protein [Portunus trituberculatus]
MAAFPIALGGCVSSPILEAFVTKVSEVEAEIHRRISEAEFCHLISAFCAKDRKMRMRLCLPGAGIEKRLAAKLSGLTARMFSSASQWSVDLTWKMVGLSENL